MLSINDSDTIVQSMFTVLDVSGLSITTMPYEKRHAGVEYSFYANKTLVAEGFNDTLRIRFPSIPDSWSQTPRNNDMFFTVRFQGGSQTIDLSFAFIHSGLKLIINGSRDEPGTWVFKFNPYRLKNYLNSLHRGYLVFDYSDIHKAAQAFTYSKKTGELTVNVPTNFRIDPAIFENGFETCYTPWTGTIIDGANTLECSTDFVNEGTNSSHSYVEQAQGNKAKVYKDFTDESEVYVRFYVYIENISLTAWKVWSIVVLDDEDYGGHDQVILSIYTGPGYQFHLRLSYPYTTAGTSTDYGTGSWILMELHYRQHATLGLLELYTEDTLRINMSGKDTSCCNADRIYIGPGSTADNIGSGDYMSLYYDSVIVDTSYIGPISAGEEYSRLMNASLSYSATLNRLVGYGRDSSESYDIDATLSRGHVEYHRDLTASYSIAALLPVEAEELTLALQHGGLAPIAFIFSIAAIALILALARGKVK